MKFAVFYFRMEGGKILPITYHLQETPLREKWIEQIRIKEQEEDAYLDLKITNKSIQDLPFLKEKLNSIVSHINKVYETDRLPLLEGEINQNKLNYLHELFEEYGEESLDPEKFISKEVHDIWLSLNDWIHITEIAMQTTLDKFPCFSCLCSIYPPYDGEPLDEGDKLFLDAEWMWGSLYLGYNTLGKDYSHAMWDNDVRVIKNDQIKIQTLYSTECWLCFGQTPYMGKNTERDFYQWYLEQDEETRAMIPIHDRDKLALGRYYLGRVIIDETFTRFNSDLERWRHDPELQKRWNIEVFSKIEEFIGIEIRDTDDENGESDS